MSQNLINVKKEIIEFLNQNKFRKPALILIDAFQDIGQAHEQLPHLASYLINHHPPVFTLDYAFEYLGEKNGKRIKIFGILYYF